MPVGAGCPRPMSCCRTGGEHPDRDPAVGLEGGTAEGMGERVLGGGVVGPEGKRVREKREKEGGRERGREIGRKKK